MSSASTTTAAAAGYGSYDFSRYYSANSIQIGPLNPTGNDVLVLMNPVYKGSGETPSTEYVESLLQGKIDQWKFTSATKKKTYAEVNGLAFGGLTDTEIHQLLQDQDVLAVEPDNVAVGQVMDFDPTIEHESWTLDPKNAFDVDSSDNNRRRRQQASTSRFTQTSCYNWGLDRVDDLTGLDGTYHFDFMSDSHVSIYVMDSGIKKSHIDFTAYDPDTTLLHSGNDGLASVPSTSTASMRVSECYNTIPESEPCTDLFGHGTHVAGIAAGLYSGVAKNASIIDVKVLNAENRGRYSDIIEGINWIISRHTGLVAAHNSQASPTTPPPKGIVNLSLGGPYSSILNSAVDRMAEAGLLVVVAAGNGFGVDSCQFSPASALHAFTVGSTDTSDQPSDFSNIGACVDIFAPGNNIRSSSWQGDTEVITMRGTSMAVPHVVGVAALYMQQYPDLSTSDIEILLKADALDVVDVQNSISTTSLLLTTTELVAPPEPTDAPTSAPTVCLAFGEVCSSAHGEACCSGLICDGGLCWEPQISALELEDESTDLSAEKLLANLQGGKSRDGQQGRGNINRHRRQLRRGKKY